MYHTVVMVTVSLLLMMMSSLSLIATAQHTSPTGSSSATSCSYLDQDNVYNIEVHKQQRALGCSTGAVDDLCQGQRETLAGVQQEMNDVQRDVMRLLERSGDMSIELMALEQQLATVTQALDDPMSRISSDCPLGYQVRDDTLGSCYQFITRSMHWYRAMGYCISTRAHLVAIESAEEQDFLVNYITSSSDLPGANFWTGGNDVSAEGQWLWAGTGNAMDYTRWLRLPDPERGIIQQPDNDGGDEHCVHMYHQNQYEWNDESCETEFGFICEYELP